MKIRAEFSARDQRARNPLEPPPLTGLWAVGTGMTHTDISSLTEAGVQYPSRGRSASKPRIAVFYHYFPPDDVVSAVHFGDLCAGLAQRGWTVSAFPTVWGCRDESARFPRSETWQGVLVRRIWRPRFRQSVNLGRMLNAFFMIAAWSAQAVRRPAPDVVLIGTDPVLSILSAVFWKLVRPRTKIVHWCFDLYPEAAIADGLLKPDGIATGAIRRMLVPAYGACSLIVDIGPCMRRLLSRYPTRARRETSVPWALHEPAGVIPPDAAERERLFPGARIGLLYSGNFGRAHSYSDILRLAEFLAPGGGCVTLSMRGNREMELRAAVKKSGSSVRFVSPVTADKLGERLASADVHVVSLQPEWNGTVIPSKFFGALAIGRPVLFSGPRDSSIAHWIQQYNLGWILDNDRVAEVGSQLLAYASDRGQQAEMQKRCFEVYQQQFSRAVQIDRWNSFLRIVVSNEPAVSQEHHDEE